MSKPNESLANATAPSFRILSNDKDDIPAAIALVNSAYRGDSSRIGWTTEADLLDGIRTCEEEMRDIIRDRETKRLLLFFHANAPEILIGSVLVEKKKNPTPSLEDAGEDSSIYIGMFVVKPELQRQGLGKFILSTAEQYSKSVWMEEDEESVDEKSKKKKSCTIIRYEMTVIKQRKELIAWYVKRGYRVTKKHIPFPYGEERFGIPKVSDLEFVVLVKEDKF